MTTFIYVLAWKLLRFVPDSIAIPLFKFIGRRLGKNPKLTAQLRKNLARVLAKDSEAVTDKELCLAMESYLHYWAEAFRMPYWSKKHIKTKLTGKVANVTYLEQALKLDKGVILVLPHTGNWDAAGLWLVNTFDSFTTIAERLKPEYLFNKFVEYREKLGFEIIPLTGGEIPPSKILAERLKQGKIVCLLGDRDLTKHGVEVSFFGEKTRMPAGPASLAKKTGAALLPVHCWTEGNDNYFVIEPPLDTSKEVPEIVQEEARVFEKNIKNHPYDWHMMQPLWENDWSERVRNRINKPNS